MSFLKNPFFGLSELAIPKNELLWKIEKKFHILELLHKWSKSHEEKDDEQGDKKDEKTHKKKILPSPPLPSPQPSLQQKQKRKLTNEQGDK